MKKEMMQVLVELQRQNWRLKRTRKGYMAFPPPLSSEEEAGRRVLHPQREEPVTVHLTPSDWRAWRNMISELRKRGFVWPPKDRRRRR